MLIVTGGAGFIGSNLVHELNAHGLTDILVVDNFANVKKFSNLNWARYADFMDKREFRRAIREQALDAGKVEAILHQGACSNTLEDDGVYMMDNNFQYTKEVLAFAIREGTPRPDTLPPPSKTNTPSTSTATRSWPSTTTSATRWKWIVCPSRPSDCATSTSMARASSTRDGWLPSFTTSPNR
jgi:hypothetical protein